VPRKQRHPRSSGGIIRLKVVPGARFCMTWERAEEIAGEALAFLRGDGG
jgi:hypothetical protein